MRFERKCLSNTSLTSIPTTKLRRSTLPTLQLLYLLQSPFIFSFVIALTFLRKLFDLENPSHETVMTIRDLNLIAAELDMPHTLKAKEAIERTSIKVYSELLSPALYSFLVKCYDLYIRT